MEIDQIWAEIETLKRDGSNAARLRELRKLALSTESPYQLERERCDALLRRARDLESQRDQAIAVVTRNLLDQINTGARKRNAAWRRDFNAAVNPIHRQFDPKISQLWIERDSIRQSIPAQYRF